MAFEAAYRLRSFTRAAEELALSQASVSRRIRELEGDLCLPLFERRRYDVMPTMHADRLVATVRWSLNELAATTNRLRDNASASNRLVIFSDLSLGNALVAPIVGEFQRRHPELQLRVLSSSEPIESLGEEFDIGLQYGRWAQDKFSIESIADEIIFPVCSPSRAAQFSDVISPVDIAKQPLLHLSDPHRKWPDWRNFLALFRVKEPVPIEGLQFSSYHICLDVAEKGEGIALGWARTLGPRLDSGRLLRIPGMTMALPKSVNVHRPKSAESKPVIDEFLQLLRSNIEPISEL